MASLVPKMSDETNFPYLGAGKQPRRSASGAGGGGTSSHCSSAPVDDERSAPEPEAPDDGDGHG